MKLQTNKGFTLVEIAIVLVIVGLLIGGVLKGQEMITNAKLKRIESDNAAIAAAMFSYQDRYLQLPGDDGGASGRFDFYSTGSGALGAKANGDGNGVVGNDNVGWDLSIASSAWTASGTTNGEENSKFFGHMRAAGLIPGGSGSDPTRPTNAYGGLIGLQSGALGMSGHVVVFGQIEGAISRILEARLDDNSRATGRIQSIVISGSSSEALNNDPTSFSDTTYQEADRYDMAFRL